MGKIRTPQIRAAEIDPFQVHLDEPRPLEIYPDKRSPGHELWIVCVNDFWCLLAQLVPSLLTLVAAANIVTRRGGDTPPVDQPDYFSATLIWRLELRRP